MELKSRNEKGLSVMTSSKVWVYRIAIAWALLYITASIITSTLAGIVNVDVTKLNTQAKIILILTVLGNVISTVMAFLSNAAKKLEDGKLPINGAADVKTPNDTTFTKKTEITTTSVQQTNEKVNPISSGP